MCLYRTEMKKQTFQINWNTTFDTLEQVLPVSFSSEGMYGIHFSENSICNP